MSGRTDRRGFFKTSLMISAWTLFQGCVRRRTGGDSASRRTNGTGNDTENGVRNGAGDFESPSDPVRARSSSKYREAPMLAAMVAAGKLPPVDSRLPREPFVRETDAIGRYGGTLYDQTENQGGRFHLDGALLAFPQETDNDGILIRPHLCSKVEMNKDATEFIFHIREGLKWSDGIELTADDILWWWEYEQNNRELYPEGPRSTWKVGDEYAKFFKIDKWTFKIKFPAPYRPCLNISAQEWMSFGSFFGQPAHWMKQFHIGFNPKANELAKERGYEAWYQLYKENEELMRPGAGKPHVGPWIKTVSETAYEIYERNPYFAEVDAAGNQLPYIDRIFVSVVEDRKLRDARSAAGDVSQSEAELSQIFVYRSNGRRAGYGIKKWVSSNGSECMFAFNLNHKDPVKRGIYNDLRFRQALSYAIDREKINRTLYFGIAKEYQAALDPRVSYFNREWLGVCAAHRPDKAAALMDRMGLKWDDRRKYRLRPDGKRLSTVILFNRQFPVEILEMVRQDWESAGMETIIKETDFKFREERCRAGSHDCTCWNADMIEESAAYLPWVTKWNPDRELYYAIEWWSWYRSGGRRGEEPPAEWKEQFRRMAEWYQARDDGHYRRLGREVWDFFSRQLVCIGTVAYGPRPVVVKNGLRNVREIRRMGYGTLWAKSYGVQTYFWDQPNKHL
jgi:peptide/nickel transport system substrate-binding protein